MPLNASDFGGASAPKPWVSGAQYAIGTVVLSTVDFCYYVRKVAGAGTTDPSSDTTNWQNTNGIKSIQRGSFAAVATVTISSVNIAKSTVSFSGYGVNSAGTLSWPAGGQFSNSTTLTVNMGPATGGGTGYYEITERF